MLQIIRSIKKYILNQKAVQNVLRGNWWTLFIITMVFVILTYTILTNWETIASFQWKFNWINLLITIISYSLGLSAIMVPWHIIISRLSGQKRWITDFRIYSLSIAARRIPLPIWYVGSRILQYQKVRIGAAYVITASGIEFALIGLSGILLFSLLLPWYPYIGIWSWLITFFAGSAFILLTIWPRSLTWFINAILKALKRNLIANTMTRQDLLSCGILYGLSWIFSGISLNFTINTFSPESIPWYGAVGATTLSGLLSMASMLTLPGGFGLKELSLGIILNTWLPLSVGLVISLLFRIVQTLIEILWALVAQRIFDVA